MNEKVANYMCFLFSCLISNMRIFIYKTIALTGLMLVSPPQAHKKRSQSQTASLPSTPLSDPSYPELFDRINLGRQNNDESPQAGSEGISKDSRPVKTSTPEKKTNKKGQGQPPSKTSILGNSSSSLTSLSSNMAASQMSSPDSLTSSLCSASHDQTGSETNLDKFKEDAGENEDATPSEADTMESLITKRASSFRKAMTAHPITSADITELVVRCGGAGSLHMSPVKGSSRKTKQSIHGKEDTNETSVDGKESSKELELPEDSPSVKDALNVSKSDLEDSDNEDEYNVFNEDLESQITAVSRAISNGSFLSHGDDSDRSFNGVGNSKMERVDQEKSISARSASLPLLNDSGDEEDCDGSNTGQDETSRIKDAEDSLGKQRAGTSRKQYQQQNCSHSVEDICGEQKESVRKSQAGRGRMSRRDLQDRAAHFKKKSVGSHEEIPEQAQNTHTSDTNQTSETKEDKPKTELSPDKAVLLRNKVKGLRLPNTHKHLSVQDYSSISALRSRALADGSRAKLIGWSSADKLTKGSMTDVSHLEEDPWVRKSEDGLTIGDSSASRAQENQPCPRVHSELGCSSSNSSGKGSKENLDWLVYLNRNSTGSPSSPLMSPSHSNNQNSSESIDQHIPTHVSESVSSSDLSNCRDARTPKKWNAVHYATPPRAFMTPENMHKFGTSSQESSKNDATRKVSRPQPFAAAKPCPTKITLARPVKLQEASNLSRSNSLPTTACHGSGMSYGALKALSKNRHSSIQDFDHLSEQESAQKMIAEMEEYIKAVTEPVHESGHYRCLPQRFPTSLPAITVEEEDIEDCDGDDDDDDTRPQGTNRLSVISSVSTSSYESQGSWSSGGSDEILGGLVGTLKHKLHTWAKDSNETEGQERENTSSSDNSTINQASALASDDESDNDYLSAETEGPNMHSKLISTLESEKKTSTGNDRSRSVSNSRNETLTEDRQLESVLREHSLGSSSLGLRMAKTVIPSGYLVGREDSPSKSRSLQPEPNDSGCTSPEYPQQPNRGASDNNEKCRSDTNTAGPINGRVSVSVCDVNSTVNKGGVNQDSTNNSLTFPADPLATRFSLPPTKEATEALMPPALRGEGCEMQQSDSGFSLQSTASSSNDGSSGDLAQSSDVSPMAENVTSRLEQSKCAVSAPTSNSEVRFPCNVEYGEDDLKIVARDSPEVTSEHSERLSNSVIGDSNKSSDVAMKRSDSCGSMDSTDSFYERRLSVAFESDAFRNVPSVLKVCQELQFDQRSVDSVEGPASDLGAPTTFSGMTLTSATSAKQPFPLVQAEAETALSRRSIREYVQSIEEMFKPQSPKVSNIRIV